MYMNLTLFLYFAKDIIYIFHFIALLRHNSPTIYFTLSKMNMLIFVSIMADMCNHHHSI